MQAFAARSTSGAGAQWAAELMARQRQEVRAERDEIEDGYFACRLRRVAMEDAARVADHRGHAATGWMTPVSLFAAIKATRGRSPRSRKAAMRAAHTSNWGLPSESTGRISSTPGKPTTGEHARMLGRRDEQPVERMPFVLGGLPMRRQGSDIGLGCARW